MPVRHVLLTERFDAFIASALETGQYGEAREIVQEGLRVLEQHHSEDRAKAAWLRGAAQEGINAVERGEVVSLPTAEAVRTHLRGLRANK